MKMSERCPLLLAALAMVAACAQAPAGQAPTPSDAARSVSAVESITADDIYQRVAYLASDALRGRATPSPGLDSAAAYLAAEHRRLGLSAGGDEGSFLQRYPLRRVGLDTTTVHFGHLLAGGSGNEMLVYGEDFFALPGGTREGLDMNHAHLSYVGALGPNGLPSGTYEGTVPIVTIPGTFGPSWQAEVARARAVTRAAGATAVAVVMSPEVPADLFRQVAMASRQSTRTVVGEPDPDELAVFVITDAVLQRLSEREGIDPRSMSVRPLPFTRVEAHFASRMKVVEESFPPNVVAVLRGSDPQLRNEYVVLSAHMDHVGVGEPVNGDSIYNGADDDASGTSALVEVAEALSLLPEAPRRSVVFLHVSGEESGLLGSQYFSEHPTFPMDQVVANINVDMIGRNSPDSVVVIGKDYSTLGALADSLQAVHPELGLTLSDDIWPEERFFFRSDHFHFARKEVPSLFFFSGVHEDYHEPSDEVEKLDVDKAARITRMIFHLVREVANAEERPSWNPAGLAEVRALTGG